MPIAASASARPAKIPSSSARNRGRAAESANTCSIVLSLTIGSAESCERTACWMSRASASSGSDRPNDDVHVARREVRDTRRLIVQEIQLGPGLLRHASLFHVADHADDGEGRCLGTEERVEAVADGIEVAIAIEGLRERLVDEQRRARRRCLPARIRAP